MLKFIIGCNYGIVLDIRKLPQIDVRCIDKQFHSSNDYNDILSKSYYSVASCSGLADNLAILEDLFELSLIDCVSVDPSIVCRSYGYDLGLVPCILADHWYPDRWYQSVNNWFGQSLQMSADFRLVD